MKLYYPQYIAEIDGVKVSVFITKRGTNGAWHTIVSTNTNLSFVKTIEIYNIRWTIEVFFYVKSIVMQSVTKKFPKNQGVRSLTLQNHFP